MAPQFLDRLASPTSATSTAPRQVLQTYFPRRPDEILLTINDIVDVKSTFADGWAVGFNRTTSSEGAFPVVCILTTEELAELEEMMLEERRKALRQQQQQQQQSNDDVDDGRLEMTSFMVKPLPTETDYESLQLYSVESASDTEATAITTTTTTTATTATASPSATRERGEIGILTSIFSAVKNTFASLALHSHSNNSAHSQNLDIGRIIQPRTDSLEKQSDQPSSSPVIISPSSSRTSASSPPLQPPPPVVPRPRPLSSIFRPTQQFQSHHSNEPNIVHAFEHTRLSPRLPPPRLPSSPLRLPQIPGMPKPHPADVIDPIPSQQQSQQPKPSLLSTLHKPWNYQYLLESRDRINTPESLRQRLEALSVIKNQQQQTSQPQSQSQLQLQTQIQPQHNLYPDYI
ncbi:hypothetical protein GQ42DRAFT_154942 [Ramicandelaber brevisporus]|nr:hypothetical protein GQ42DRAFT_154942 [Ramicandelaber brevisporus]